MRPGVPQVTDQIHQILWRDFAHLVLNRMGLRPVPLLHAVGQLVDHGFSAEAAVRHDQGGVGRDWREGQRANSNLQSGVSINRKVSRPPRAEKPSVDVISRKNEIALERAKPSKNPVADEKSWEKTKAKFMNSTMLGPYYYLGDIPRTPG